MKKFFSSLDFQGWLWLFFPVLVAGFLVFDFSGRGDAPAKQETMPQDAVSSDAFDILWYASEDIEFLSPGESWANSDFEVIISDIVTGSYSSEYPGIAIDLKPSRLSPVDAFYEGTLQFYLYAMEDGSILELLSGYDFLAYADAEIIGSDHGRAVIGIPSEADYLLVMVVADGSVYRATYTPG